MEVDQERSDELLLNTTVDGNVSFTALSVLASVVDGTRAQLNGNTKPLPVAGSKDWLPSVVVVGRQQVRHSVGVSCFVRVAARTTQMVIIYTSTTSPRSKHVIKLSSSAVSCWNSLRVCEIRLAGIIPVPV